MSACDVCACPRMGETEKVKDGGEREKRKREERGLRPREQMQGMKSRLG